MPKRVLTIVFLILLILLLSGCSTKSIDTNIKKENVAKAIELKITSTKQFPQGISYSIMLKNGSQSLIKQNDVYISFPINNGNGDSTNRAKIEAEGNKLDIQPGENVLLNAFIPAEYYESKKINKNSPWFEIEGYINEVKDANRLEIEGALTR